jgi:hypothetical protein
MPLGTGVRLGACEILHPIGEGLAEAKEPRCL